jgi:hypothetical protein
MTTKATLRESAMPVRTRPGNPDTRTTEAQCGKPTTGGSTLHASDLAQFEQLSIPPELLGAAQVRRVTHQQAQDDAGIRYHSASLEGIWFPNLDPEHGRVRGGRVRRDHPEVDTAGKAQNKYLGPPGRHYLYFAPGAAPMLCDISVSIVVVEAEKSALAVAASAGRANRRLLPIATGGCWAWKGTIGKTTDAGGARVDEKGPLPDLNRITWINRDAVIMFDANAATVAGVQAARQALAKDLAGRGARVRLADLPTEPGINGPDDYVGKHGNAALFALIDDAKPMHPASCADILRLAGLADIRGLTLTDLEPRLRRLKDGLKGADALRRRTLREILVAALKAAKIGGAAALADAAVAGLDEPDLEGPAAGFLADEVPWPDPVDGPGLLDSLVEHLNRYVVLPHRHAVHALVLWVVLTYFDAVVNLLPLLLVTSPTKRCGKTKTVEVVGGLACRALPVSNITAAALYRAIDRFHPTLLLDEADTFFNDDPELRGVINAGHTRHTARVIRCVGDDSQPTLFSTWCPKLIAMIGTPKDTILDRSIVISLQRKAPGETVAQLRADQVHLVFADLRRQIRRFADDHLDGMRTADATMPAGLHDRAADNWRPLVAIADLVGGEWPRLARLAAVEMAAAGVRQDDSIGALLLGDIREVFGTKSNISSKLLCEQLAAIEARPWATWGKHEKPITQNALARQLRPFDIEPRSMRLAATERAPDQAELAKGYARADFDTAFARYAPSSNRNTVTDAAHIDDLTDSKRNTPGPTVTVAVHDLANETGACYGVTGAPGGDELQSSDPEQEVEVPAWTLRL